MTPGARDFWFLPLGGTGEIGMNLNLYGHDGQWLMIDCGVSFDEPLSEGGATQHRVCADPTFIEDRKEALAGIVITHAHEDHIGALPDLWARFPAPVYTTAFTAEILRRKLAREGLAQVAEIIEVDLDQRVSIGVFSLRWLSTTHSIPEPSSILIETTVGKVLHTGDWKIDTQPVLGKGFDASVFQSLACETIDAMVCDSTNALKPGHSVSESDCHRGLYQWISEAKGRVVVSCFASNIARLVTLARIAQASGRYLCLLGYSLENMYAVARAKGIWPIEQALCSPEHAGYLPPEEILFVSTGSQGEPRSALARLANKQHRSVELEAGDLVIFSAMEIPGNEDAIARLVGKLEAQSIRVVRRKDSALAIHASGHPNQDELKALYDWVQPRVAIPVHGEPEHIDAHALLAKRQGVQSQLRGKNGDLYLIAPHIGIRRNAVNAGRIALSKR